MKLLHDKVVVITGSGGGIGEACARRFAAEGAKVVVTDIDPVGVARVSESIGTAGLAVDITDKESVRAVVDLARRSYGEIDVWFSNAGYAGPRQPDHPPGRFALATRMATARYGARTRST